MKLTLSKMFSGRPAQKSAPVATQETAAPDAGQPEVGNPSDQVDVGKTPKKPNPVLKWAGKATKAVFLPPLKFVGNTVADTAITAGLSAGIAAATVGAMAVAGPIGLAVPAVAGTAIGIASRGSVKKAFKNKKDARFQAMGTGFAYAALGYGGLIGGTTLAGVAGFAAATGAIYGGLNSMTVQTAQAFGILNKT